MVGGIPRMTDIYCQCDKWRNNERKSNEVYLYHETRRGETKPQHLRDNITLRRWHNAYRIQIGWLMLIESICEIQFDLWWAETLGLSDRLCNIVRHFNEYWWHHTVLPSTTLISLSFVFIRSLWLVCILAIGTLNAMLCDWQSLLLQFSFFQIISNLSVFCNTN